MKIKIVKAFEGDCILISFLDNNNARRNILIDGGTRKTYVKQLKNILKSVKSENEFIDLLIVTHIHDDHIGGILEFYKDIDFNKEIIKKVWFNSQGVLKSVTPNLEIESEEIDLQIIDSLKMGVKSGYTLENELKRHSGWEEKIISFGNIIQIENTKITVLTPTLEGIKSLKKVMNIEEDESRMQASSKKDYDKSISELVKKKFVEDTSDTNRSSISILVEYLDKKVLFLSDCWSSDLILSLKKMGYSTDNKLKIDYLKLSHHASKKNINEDFLNLIDCKKYIVSTNGSKHGLPNKEALARIIDNKQSVEFYFNYDIYNEIFSEDELLNYKIKCCEIEEIEV